MRMNVCGVDRHAKFDGERFAVVMVGAVNVALGVAGCAFMWRVCAGSALLPLCVVVGATSFQLVVLSVYSVRDSRGL